MARGRSRDVNLPARYLKRVWIDVARVPDRVAYPFCLPFLGDDFELRFERAITIIVGENGTGKSTLLEGHCCARRLRRSRWRQRLYAGRPCRSAGEDGRRTVGGAARELAAQDHQWPVLSRRKLLPLDKSWKEDPFKRGPPPDFLSHSHGE